MIDQSIINIFRQNAVRMHTFAHFALDSGDYYLWDGVNQFTDNGITYKGIGTLGRVEYSEDALSKLARPLSLTLSASYIDKEGNLVASGDIEEALGLTLTSEPLQGRFVNVFEAITDLNATQILAKTIRTISAKIDRIDITEDVSGSKSMRIHLEDRTASLNKVKARRLSLDTHQEDNSGSTFLAQMASLKVSPVLWGRES